MTDHVHELLTRAQNLIRDPKNWTTDAFARTKDGRVVDDKSKNAACFCSLGALRRAGYDERAARLLSIAMGGIGSARIIAFNDHGTHDQVMEAWDRARELAVG